MVNRSHPDNQEAKQVLITAHEVLLQGSTDFWEAAWLGQHIEGLSR